MQSQQRFHRTTSLGYVEFFGLPTGIYAKDGVGKQMYTVEEITPPVGYEEADRS